MVACRVFWLCGVMLISTSNTHNHSKLFSMDCSRSREDLHKPASSAHALPMRLAGDQAFNVLLGSDSVGLACCAELGACGRLAATPGSCKVASADAATQPC